MVSDHTRGSEAQSESSPASGWSLHARHDDVSQSVRKTTILLLSVGAYSLTTLSTSYKAILEEKGRIPLPVLDVMVPREHFLLAGPILIVILFIHLHLLLRHKRRLEGQIFRKTDAHTASSPPTGPDLRYPAFFHFDEFLARAGTVAVFFVFVPLVLVAFLLSAALFDNIVFCQVLVVVSVGLAVGLAQSLDALARVSLLRLIRKPLERLHPAGQVRGLLHAFLVSLWTLLFIAIGVFWIRDGSERSRDVSGVQLQGRNLFGREFMAYDLSYARIDGADLRHANLTKAILREATLEGARLEGAKLTGANLFKISADCADFTRAFLERADLRFAGLRGARLRETRARWIDAAGARFGIAADLNGIDLHGGHMNGVELPQAKLVLAGLRADFSWSCLVQADFTRADLIGAKLLNTDARGACFERASVNKAVLIEAQLQGADFTNATLSGALLHGANLTGASLHGADLRNASLTALEPGEFDWAEHRYGGEQNLNFPSKARDEPIQPTLLRNTDLSGALMDCTDLSGVDLRTTRGLETGQLETAVGDANTLLPEIFSQTRLLSVWQEQQRRCREQVPLKHVALSRVSAPDRPSVPPEGRACARVRAIRASWDGSCGKRKLATGTNYEQEWCGEQPIPRTLVRSR